MECLVTCEGHRELAKPKDDSELGQMVSERSLEIARRYSRRKGILKGDDLARMFA